MIVAIANALIVQNGRLLLVQQRKPIAYGLWSCPGGHVELGETPRAAVIREVAEETGLTLISPTYVQLFTCETTEATLHIHTYTGDVAGTITLRQDELLAYGWFSLEEIVAMRSQLRTAVVLEQAHALFATLPPRTRSA